MINDFHCHSNWFDGTFSTEQLIALAIKENIKHLSITDHDTVGDTLNAFSLSKKAILIMFLELNFHVKMLSIERRFIF
ncbi:PHP domain-containing protein [endosymbiont 'TC1' of Trimyema compressum]|uniref:PHP domain-containing protein n=1 Tax=endosymbiont 'TC1' of Trimyema compressum TaxID=243899 RepID=UPI0013922552|nr:PHP domain-containing protein [endosymbiont 'TC1' of Trimyema compressum]